MMVEIRGQIAPMWDILNGLTIGLAMSVVVIALLLTANFQSVRLALVAVATLPAVIAGVVVALWLSGTTLNLQSFMGAIMAIGVAVANAILLVTFAERSRLAGASVREASVRGARERLRPILMTSLALIMGVLPLAISTGAGAQSRIAIGTSVMGGMLTATVLAIFFVPLFYVLVRRVLGRHAVLPSLDGEGQLAEGEQGGAVRAGPGRG
jgi:multidrug efflux pump subunit AcrB